MTCLDRYLDLATATLGDGQAADGYLGGCASGSGHIARRPAARGQDADHANRLDDGTAASGRKNVLERHTSQSHPIIRVGDFQRQGNVVTAQHCGVA